MGELELPKSDQQVYFSSEANSALEIVELTSGEALTAGKIGYIKKNNGLIYTSGTGTADDIRADGIILNTVSSGEKVYLMRKGIYATSGLTTGEVYYLGAAGAISTTFSGVEVGYAESTTKLFICIQQDNTDAVGTVKAYVKSFTGIPSNNISAFWVECNGQVLADTESPLNGQTIPDLNSVSKMLLRGNTTSGGTGTENYLPTHKHDMATNIPGGNDRLDTIAGAAQYNTKWFAAKTAGTAMTYYDVVWIIKIK